jgi:hypothetical protein
MSDTVPEKWIDGPVTFAIVQNDQGERPKVKTINPDYIEWLERDAARYRWLRSEEASTDPRYYPFWDEFCAKSCRESRMDAAIDAAMKEKP